MARSLKKGPYVDAKLVHRIEDLNRTNAKRVVQTWSRRSMVTPDFVGHTLAVHNGKKFLPVFWSFGAQLFTDDRDSTIHQNRSQESGIGL